MQTSCIGHPAHSPLMYEDFWQPWPDEEVSNEQVQDQESTWLALPYEIRSEIFSYLSPADILSMRLTSAKIMHMMTSYPPLQERILLKVPSLQVSSIDCESAMEFSCQLRKLEEKNLRLVHIIQRDQTNMSSYQASAVEAMKNIAMQAGGVVVNAAGSILLTGMGKKMYDIVILKKYLTQDQAVALFQANQKFLDSMTMGF